MTRDEIVDHLVGRRGAVFDTWSEEAARVWVRARFCCEYCDSPLLTSHKSYRSAEVDHILPRSQFGEPGTDVGLALACRHCNWLKRDMLIDDDSLVERLQQGDLSARADAVAMLREVISQTRHEYDRKLEKLRAELTRFGAVD